MSARIRPSFLHLLNKCPMAADESRTETLELIPVGINARKQGRVGQAFHHLMAGAISTGSGKPTGQQIDDASIEFTVEFRELYSLIENGWNWWEQLKGLYPNPICEKKLSHEIMDGTPDLVSLNDGIEARGLDWKSGFVLRDHTEQIEGYCWMIFREHPKLQRVYFLVVNIRTGSVIPFRRTREQSEKWWARTQSYRAERRYVVNSDCDSCPRVLTCPAVREWISQASDTIGKNLIDHDLQKPVDLLAGHDAAEFLARLADRYKTATEALLLAGGPVQYKDRTVRMKETIKESIIAPVVLRVMLTRYGVTAEQLCTALSFTKESIYKVLAPLAEAQGMKKKDFVQEFYDVLRKEGGIEERVSHSLEVEHFDVESPPTV